MGVMVGILSNGSAPCVELPESPDITIGKPMAFVSTSYNSWTRKTIISDRTEVSVDEPVFRDHADIANVREIEVKRKFLCKKEDINEVLAWLATLSGGSVAYNAGADGEKTLAGGFQVSGKIKCASVSPTLEQIEVEFVGFVLDCNFLLPGGLAFTKVTDKKYQVVVGETVMAEYESSTDGDGSGLAIRAGRVLYWDEIAESARASLSMTLEDLPTSAEDVASTDVVYMLQYRELLFTINGEVISKWFIPCYGLTERKRLYIKPLYYGVTEAEYTAGVALTAPVDLSLPNPRLGGDFVYATSFPGGTPVLENLPSPRQASVRQVGYGYADMINNGSWVPTFTQQVASVVPRTYTRYTQIGWDYVPTRVRVSGKPSTDALITVYWKEKDAAIQLCAVGVDKVERILMEYPST